MTWCLLREVHSDYHTEYRELRCIVQPGYIYWPTLYTTYHCPPPKVYENHPTMVVTTVHWTSYLEWPGTKSHSTLISRRIMLWGAKLQKKTSYSRIQIPLSLDCWLVYVLFVCGFSDDDQRPPVQQTVEQVAEVWMIATEGQDASARFELVWTFDLVYRRDKG